MDIDTYNQILSYVDKNPIATLSTINPDGSPHGAIVYVVADDYRHVIYCLTKTQTRKYTNLKKYPSVSLTIVRPSDNSTLQTSGRAFEVHDMKIIDSVMKKVAQITAVAPEWLPPLSKLNAGELVLIGIDLTYARLAHFKDRAIGDESIFIEMTS
jgi:general stress protein 26